MFNVLFLVLVPSMPINDFKRSDAPVAQYQVTNKTTTTSTFKVVNKTTPITPVRSTIKKVVGCACSIGHNCSAGFCKANGGSGCPVSCPISGVKNVVVTETNTTSLSSNNNASMQGNGLKLIGDTINQPQLSQPFSANPFSSSSNSNCPNGMCPTSNSRSLFPRIKRG